MITDFKIFENNKPKKSDPDYINKWVDWVTQQLIPIFGEPHQGGNADWGGLTLWDIGDDYFIAQDSYYFFLTNRTFEEGAEFNDGRTETSISAKDDDIENLMLKISELLPKYRNMIDIEKYTKLKKINEFNI